jgi:hypothetical protein
MTLDEALLEMKRIYSNDPVVAVRGQAFIKILHDFLAEQLDARLSKAARRRGIKVMREPMILGSHKPKNVDVAVIDPTNGPLLVIGVRSQMSSVSKNVLNYYEGIVGECISLQDRFPMAVNGYVYLMPLRAIKVGSESQAIDHQRYARMYAQITGRAGQDYKSTRGVYDHFAYMVVDFNEEQPVLLDDLVTAAAPHAELRVDDFVDRMTATFSERHLFLSVFD